MLVMGRCLLEFSKVNHYTTKYVTSSYWNTL
jgi:hypothetical protein